MSPIDKKGSKKSKLPGVTKLTGGRWEVYRTWVDKKTGRRIHRRKVVTGDREAAIAARASLSPAPSAPKQPRPRFGDFATAWLERHDLKRKLSPSTKARYQGDVAQLIVQWREWWIDAIDYEAIEAWQAEVGRDFAAPTVNGWHRTLKLILESARKMGHVKSNAARDVSALRETRTGGRRGRSLAGQEFVSFLAGVDTAPALPPKSKRKASVQVLADATAVQKSEQIIPRPIPEDVRRAVLVLAWTGCRIGELLELRWADVVDDELRIERAVWRGHKKPTKSDDPRRVTIVSPLEAALQEQRRWLIATQHPGLESGLCFPATARHAAAGAKRRKGVQHWYRSQSTIREAVLAVATHAKVPQITPHSLRRTFEDLLREAGVDKLVRRAVAGWRSEKAQGIYATVSREERDEAAAALVELVLRGGRR